MQVTRLMNSFLSSFQEQWQYMLGHDGLVVAGVGLAIVFTALTLLSAGIALLPLVLRWVHTWLPEPEKLVQAKPAPDDEAFKVAAAVAALHRHRKARD